MRSSSSPLPLSIAVSSPGPHYQRCRPCSTRTCSFHCQWGAARPRTGGGGLGTSSRPAYLSLEPGQESPAIDTQQREGRGRRPGAGSDRIRSLSPPAAARRAPVRVTCMPMVVRPVRPEMSPRSGFCARGRGGRSSSKAAGWAGAVSDGGRSPQLLQTGFSFQGKSTYSRPWT